MVASIRKQIELDAEAYARLFSSFTQVASHQSITSRMEKIGGHIAKHKKALAHYVGDAEAERITGEVFVAKVG